MMALSNLEFLFYSQYFQHIQKDNEQQNRNTHAGDDLQHRFTHIPYLIVIFDWSISRQSKQVVGLVVAGGIVAVTTSHHPSHTYEFPPPKGRSRQSELLVHSTIIFLRVQCSKLACVLAQ